MMTQPKWSKFRKDYIEPTPVKKKPSSLTQKLGKRKTERKERSKKQGQRSEEDDVSEEESEFFLTKKEKKAINLER